VCSVLESLGYLDGEQVAPAGQSLARVYSESDLLAVESVRQGLWDDLSPAELAAGGVDAGLLRPARRRVEPAGALGPGAGGAARDGRLWEELGEAESRAGVEFLRQPDYGFAWATWRWAGGATLEQVLGDDPT
jgi:ATP-dependent RNA helicase HelY